MPKKSTPRKRRGERRGTGKDNRVKQVPNIGFDFSLSKPRPNFPRRSRNIPDEKMPSEPLLTDDGKILMPDERKGDRRIGKPERRIGSINRRKRQVEPVRVDAGTPIYRRRKGRQIFESPNTRRGLKYTPKEAKKGIKLRPGEKRKGRHTDRRLSQNA